MRRDPARMRGAGGAGTLLAGAGGRRRYAPPMEPYPVAVDEEIRRRLGAQRMRGDFGQVHVAPAQPEDVPDMAGTRLVVLGPDHPHVEGGASSPALEHAGALLAQAGRGVPRAYRNMLVFVAPEPAPLNDLRQAVGRFLAGDGDDVDALLRAAWTWLLAPSASGWTATRAPGRDELAMRASRELRAAGSLFVDYPAARLRADLDRVPLWPAGQDHVRLALVWDAYARSLDLPRLRSSAVLAAAVVGGLAAPDWASETFAYAEGFDAETGRYHGLVAGRAVALQGSGLIVRSEAAQDQLAGGGGDE
jgi:hypothetical protein